MNKFDTFAKLAAIVIIGGVAKSLFGQPRVIYRSSVRDAVASNVRDLATDVVSSASKSARSSG